MVSKKFILLALLFIVVSTLDAQIDFTPPVSRFKITDLETTRVIEIHNDEGSVIKTIDLLEINPFEGIGRKSDGIDDEYYTPIYIVDSTTTALNGISLVSPRNHPKNTSLKPSKLLTYYTWSNYGDKHLAVVYKLITLNEFGQNITINSKILIFNSEGEQSASLALCDWNMGKPVITNDGKYIMYIVGGPFGWDQSPYMLNELYAYDVQDDSLVYKESNIDVFMNLGISGSSLLHTSTRTEVGGQETRFFDFEKKRIYTINFSSLNDLVGIAGSDENGIVYKRNEGDYYYKFLFQRDFKISKIPTKEK